jgi:hypothetical protein
MRIWSRPASCSQLPRACAAAPSFIASRLLRRRGRRFSSGTVRPFARPNLRELGGACARIDPSIGDLAERAEDLTPFAWIFRYPGVPEEPEPDETEAALALAREVYEAVLSRLPEEVRP